MEINPRHPLIKELLRRVEDDPNDKIAKEVALMMHRTATLRSGFSLKDTVEFASSIENMMKQTLGVSLSDQPEEEEEIAEDEKETEEEIDEETEKTEDHDEL